MSGPLGEGPLPDDDVVPPSDDERMPAAETLERAHPNQRPYPVRDWPDLNTE